MKMAMSNIFFPLDIVVVRTKTITKEMTTCIVSCMVEWPACSH